MIFFTETSFKRLDTSFKGLETTFEGLDITFKGLDTSFKGLETTFKGIETTFRKLDPFPGRLFHQVQFSGFQQGAFGGGCSEVVFEGKFFTGQPINIINKAFGLPAVGGCYYIRT